jgi:hypothetical protein
LDEVEIGTVLAVVAIQASDRQWGPSKWWLKRSRGGKVVNFCRFIVLRQ